MCCNLRKAGPPLIPSKNAMGSLFGIPSSASLFHKARQQFVRMQSRFMVRHQILDHDLLQRQIPGESPQLLPHLLDGATDEPRGNAAARFIAF